MTGAPAQTQPSVEEETEIPANRGGPVRRVCVVGSGSRFLSGISYYTHRLALALSAEHHVSVLLMRRLLPRRFYPGKERVGRKLVDFRYPAGVEVFDGVDWFGLPSLIRALLFLRRERPEVLVMQWWTGTVLHSYLAIALYARLTGARTVIEFHEVQDVGELEIKLAAWYVRKLAPILMKTADGYVVHSEFDRRELHRTYPLRGPVQLIPHGPYDSLAAERTDSGSRAHDDRCRLLYFGVIRPFKGVEDLLTAFEMLDEEDAQRFTLTVVGETWENWTLPGRMIERSRYRDRIEFVNRYVSDAEVRELFDRADAIVLPYHRSSSSGPLHIAMGRGLPVVVSAVGGLIEATAGYEGAIRVAPRDPEAIRNALLRDVLPCRGQRFEVVHSWDRTLDGYRTLLNEVVA